jgi:hypothetical protein
LAGHAWRPLVPCPTVGPAGGESSHPDIKHSEIKRESENEIAETEVLCSPLSSRCAFG